MRHLGTLGVAAFLLSGLPLFAQGSGSSTPQKPPTTSGATQQPRTGGTADADTTTITGCIRAAGGGTTAADAKGNMFTLEVMDNASVGTKETGAPTPGSSAPMTYNLTAAESVGLSKHVGHQVQLTGKMKSPAATQGAATGATGTSGAGSKTGATGAKPGANRGFEVTALKMISAKCP